MSFISRHGGWRIWIDRGGTFTDVVARSASGEISVLKLLSCNPQHYEDAAIEAVRNLLGLEGTQAIPAELLLEVRMGTTVATNALLERKGAPTLLLTTRGFADALRIGYQNRPDIFALQIVLPELLFTQVIEVDERVDASGAVLRPLNLQALVPRLHAARQSGLTSCAILLMHGYRFPQHEQELERLARQTGFEQISASHKVLPLAKFVSRGDTTVADAYLSPVLRGYVDGVSSQLSGAPLYFMQSNGGLAAASHFQGKDSVLSGPAGGIVGAVKTAARCGEHKILTFDMGGTSTDVAHYAGQMERTDETEVAGVRLRAPMLAIHTVAAGGGSILSFDGARLRVGPASAGADPGPACYRRGGPPTVTDANLVLGRIQADCFPKVFGSSADEPLDFEASLAKFQELSTQVADCTGSTTNAFRIAAGFIDIACDTMATAIKRVSTQKGHDPADYCLVCFGGAGGQHACAIARLLGIKRILIHPLSGVLSALGIGLADVTVIKQTAADLILAPDSMASAQALLHAIERQALEELSAQTHGDGYTQTVVGSAYLKYAGSDFCLPVEWSDCRQMSAGFADAHRKRFGFAHDGKPIVIERLQAQATAAQADEQMNVLSLQNQTRQQQQPVRHADVFFDGAFMRTPVFDRAGMPAQTTIEGPALIVEPTSTTVLQPGWLAEVLFDGTLRLTDRLAAGGCPQHLLTSGQGPPKPDPVLLEVFNNLFMYVAEQMGITLQNTSHSVNIKERLDFSCALFDSQGNLIANAPHIPVHLGSMGESVRHMISEIGAQLAPGDFYALNDPYNGGTHLPDITVMTAFFHDGQPLFYLAARGHHADVGGITPGSMPPFSKVVEEEGALLNLVKIAAGGEILAAEIERRLGAPPYPARNLSQNIADLSAQVAALEQGKQEIKQLLSRYGKQVTASYVQFVQDNAEQAVRRLLCKLSDGHFSCSMDNGATIKVSVNVDRNAQTAVIDFSGTSAQTQDNFNAPYAICKAAVLYVFRTLVEEDIPLNSGCLKPLKLIVPPGCLLNPTHPAAVVAGNVETSQVIVDTLYGALGKLAASQGTMNNFTFGDSRLQYYETICGGAGAGPDFDGASAVQTHMTNSRLTDPEVLESRFPVLLEEFSIRTSSGGAGKHKGGDGAVRRLRFLQPLSAAVLSNRRSTAAFGLAGGSAGWPGHNSVQRADGSVEQLGSCAEIEVRAGDTIIIETPGGGGFGGTER